MRGGHGGCKGEMRGGRKVREGGGVRSWR